MKNKIIFGFYFISILASTSLSYSQSVLLIKSNSSVFDSYDVKKSVLATLNEDTWLNYKGIQGDFVKVSNFFGKDKLYPNGIFEGYVDIISILDTMDRQQFDDLHIFETYEQPFSENPDSFSLIDKETTEKKKTKYDVDNYFLGMSRQEANAVGTKKINLANADYTILTSYDENNTLSKIVLKGNHQDALSVDTSIKNTISSLAKYYSELYGNPNVTNAYPSFLEIEESGITQLYIWQEVDKSILIGIGEENKLYFSTVEIQKK
jgi:hypothetical protein